MDIDLAFILGAILALMVFSAFFSGSETALTAASRPRMHNLAQSGNRRAAIVNQLWHEREHLIGAILLGNNLVNILASALATSALIALFGDVGVVYATLAMTVLVLIFAEVMPKTYALQDADRAALTVAPGKLISIRTRSGRRVFAFSSASSPVQASPTTSRSG
jgi:Mg2+/Co2+ transporter CorB